MSGEPSQNSDDVPDDGKTKGGKGETQRRELKRRRDTRMNELPTL